MFNWLLRGAGLWLGLLAVFGGVPAAAIAAPRVLTDIAPVQSLVARVMAGVAEPELLIEGRQSPHDLALRPSQARALARADLVVWVGPALSPALDDAIDRLSAGTVLTLSEVANTRRLAFRDVAVFSEVDHADVEGQPADEDPTQSGEAGRYGVQPDGHDDGSLDPHMWLDPQNARVWIARLAEVLSALDPVNAATYAQNAHDADAELQALQQQISALLADRADTRFLLMHDAYQYFEARFGLTPLGAVSRSDAGAATPSRIADLRAALSDVGADCAFSEPQMDTRMMARLLEGSGVQVSVIDPVGADLPPGPQLYPDLLRAVAEAFASCR